MCGRFGASCQYGDIKVLQGDFPGFYPRYNIAPSQDVPVIVRNEDRNQLKTMRWGLVPSWAQDPSIGQRMIIARAETLLEKPAFSKLNRFEPCWISSNPQKVTRPVSGI